MESSHIPSNDITDEPLDVLLERLIDEHRGLDDEIEALRGSESLADLKIQRLKKRKLALKDQINKVQALLLPDIIA